MLALSIDTANLPRIDRFPEYVDPFDFEEPAPIMAATSSPKPKALARLQSDSESSRGPSPQPTHFSVPLKSHNHHNGHRVLRSATVGYIAPEFQGKVEQMKAGMLKLAHLATRHLLTTLQSRRLFCRRPGSPNLSSMSRSGGFMRSLASTMSTLRLKPPWSLLTRSPPFMRPRLPPRSARTNRRRSVLTWRPATMPSTLTRASRVGPG